MTSRRHHPKSDMGRVTCRKAVTLTLGVTVILLNLQIMFVIKGYWFPSYCDRPVNLTFQVEPLAAMAAREQWFSVPEMKGHELAIARSHQGFLTVAIPVAGNRFTELSHLGMTLNSLINHTSLADQVSNKAVIFIFGDDDFSSKVVTKVTDQYMYYINIGFLSLVRPGAGYEQRIHDTLQRFKSIGYNSTVELIANVKRTVENRIMYQYTYERYLSHFYLQYADNVVCKEHFVGDVAEFIRIQTGQWSLLEFSTAADHVGGLLKVSELNKLTAMICTFEYELRADLSRVVPLFVSSMAQSASRKYTPPIFNVIRR